MSLETRIANLDYARLKEITQLVNNTELEGIERLRVVGVKRDKMVEDFAATIEKIAEKHGEESIPEAALLLYNDLFGEGETDLDRQADVSKSDSVDVDAGQNPDPSPDPKPESKPEPKKGRGRPAGSKKAPAPTKEKPEDKSADDMEKVSAKPQEEPPVYEVDVYGTRPDTLARFFIESLQAEPKTMEEIQQESWNPKGFVFPRTVERLVEKGLASVDEKGVIFLK